VKLFCHDSLNFKSDRIRNAAAKLYDIFQIFFFLNTFFNDFIEPDILTISALVIRLLNKRVDVPLGSPLRVTRFYQQQKLYSWISN
jgi:hypothetical protein